MDVTSVNDVIEVSVKSQCASEIPSRSSAIVDVSHPADRLRRKVYWFGEHKHNGSGDVTGESVAGVMDGRGVSGVPVSTAVIVGDVVEAGVVIAGQNTDLAVSYSS